MSARPTGGARRVPAPGWPAILACLVVLGPVASATELGPPHEEPPRLPFYHMASTGYVAWNVTETTIDVALVNVVEAGSSMDVVVMLGAVGASEPTEWYVIHWGDEAVAASHDGQTLTVRSLGNQTHSIVRTAGAAGDCMMVWAQVWRIADGVKQATRTIPSPAGATPTWDNGTQCHANTAFSAPEPAVQKDSPAPLGVALVVVAAFALRRR